MCSCKIIQSRIPSHAPRWNESIVFFEIENDALFDAVASLAVKDHVALTLHHPGAWGWGCAEVVATKMADRVTDEGIQRQRGRYNEYLRHYNPYKFKAARRKNRRKVNSKTNDPNSAISMAISTKVIQSSMIVMCSWPIMITQVPFFSVM